MPPLLEQAVELINVYRNRLGIDPEVITMHPDLLKQMTNEIKQEGRHVKIKPAAKEAKVIVPRIWGIPIVPKRNMSQEEIMVGKLRDLFPD